MTSIPKILVVGDVILDKYYIGEATRLSPEAPVPILKNPEVHVSLGGAGYVYLNCLSLSKPGQIKIDICSALSLNEESGKLAAKILGVSENLFHTISVTTPVKHRFIVNGQQTLRMDQEHVQGPAYHEGMVKRINELLDDSAILVLSDYGKGCLSSTRLIADIIAEARAHHCFIIVDPKSDMTRYRGVDLIKPNKNDMSHPELGVGTFMKQFGVDNVLITKGKDGMTLYQRSEMKPIKFETHAKQIFDVTGAGDVVTAALAVGIAEGMDYHDAVMLANRAAAVAVGKLGTKPVYRDEVK